MELATRHLVQAIEVYRPEGTSDRLTRYRGCGEEHSVGEVIRGEGLFGEAWESGLPTIAPHEDGSTGATIVLPCMRGDQCQGLVVLRCQAGDDMRGAFEVWRRNDRGELGLASSWYANLGRLEQVSQYIKFPRRAGLPGRVWDDRFPRVLGGLADSKNFIRVAAARSEKLTSAVGIPYMSSPPEFDAALLILNTMATPVAKAMEVWARDLESGRFCIVSADYGSYVELAAANRRITYRRGEGIVGRVMEDGAPWLTRDLLGVEFARGEKFVEHGFETAVGLPVYIGADLVACVNLYL